MKKRILLLLFSILAFASPSSACDCEGEEATLEESLSKSTSVFLGKVVSVNPNEPSVKSKRDEKQYNIFEFQTEEVFKGENKKKISLLTEATICGGDFMEGKSYLVFALTNEQEKKLENHQCFKMSLLKQDATEEIAEIKRKNYNSFQGAALTLTMLQASAARVTL